MGQTPWNKGIPTSEEQKEKLSKAKKGIKRGPMSEDQKAKLSRALKGKRRGRMSEAHKANLSAAHKGKPWSEARRSAYNKRKEEARDD